MKKICIAGVLLLTLFFGFSDVHARKAHILNALTGTVWLDSTFENKVALIYGVECAVAIEYITAERMAIKNGEKPDMDNIVAELTPFPKNWIKAFNDVDRKDIVTELDAWYAAHPDKITEPVFVVLWEEILQPKIK